MASPSALARRPPWWAWVVALLVVVGTLGANNRTLDDRADIRLAALLALLAALALVAGAVHPAALVASGLVTGLYLAGPFAGGPILLALPALTLVLSLQSSPRRWAPWAGAAAAMVAVGAGWGAYLDPDAEGLWQGAGLVALVAAAGAVGAALRSRREARAERVERTATEERLRMAQDLHDGVGHGLAVIAMQAGAALHVLDSDPARARASLEAIRATSRESLDALRTELAEMSGATVGATALRRPAPGLDEVAGLVDRVRAAGLRVDVVGSAGEVPHRVGEVVHAVVQEALTNVLRHARAGRATVSFDRPLDAVLLVTVTDDGQDAPAAGEPGMGLAGMRARVESVGGRLEAGPTPTGPGFRVRADLPLTRQDEAS